MKIVDPLLAKLPKESADAIDQEITTRLSAWAKRAKHLVNEQDKLNERYDLTRGALERRGWFLHSTPSETVWVNKRTHETVSTGARLKVLPPEKGLWSLNGLYTRIICA